MIPEPARFPRSILNERCRYCCVRGLPGEHGTRCERRQADSAVSFAPRARAATHPVAKLSSKTSRLWWWAALTLVLSPAWGELVDSTIYGGTFHSTSTVAYAEVRYRLLEFVVVLQYDVGHGKRRGALRFCVLSTHCVQVFPCAKTCFFPSSLLEACSPLVWLKFWVASPPSVVERTISKEHAQV